MNVYERTVKALGTTRLFAVFGRRVLTPIDRLLKGRNRSLSTLGTDFPLVYLTTTGRRSGRPHISPLLVIDGPSGWMVAATNFGGPPPAWSLNLLATPSAVFEREGRSFEVVARLASDDEKTASWIQFDAVWPAFAAYRRRANRPIDVFVLDPTG